MSDYQPKYLPGNSVPLVVGAGGVVGGQLMTTAGLVAGDAAQNVAGVAGFDAPAGVIVTCIRVGIQRLVAAATITNGQPICAAAAGTIRPWVAGTDAVAAYLGTAWSSGSAGALIDAAIPLV